MNSQDVKPDDLMPAFCSGLGQKYTHRPTLSNGETNPNEYAGGPYPTVNWPFIVGRAVEPFEEAKEKSWWFIPSTYTQHDARTKAAQFDRGQFGVLCFDVDEGNKTRAEVAEAFHTCFGRNWLTLIYSTASSTADNKKWRVLIGLAALHTATHYQALLHCMNNALEGHGLKLDRALEKPSQIVYLPNRGEFYEWELLGSEWLTVPPDIIQRSVLEYKTELGGAQAKRDSNIILEPTPLIDPVTGRMNVLTALNYQTTMEDELIRYGCEARGSRWLPPGSESGQAGINVLPSRRGPWDVCYCHHSSEPDLFQRICDPAEVRIASMLRNSEAKHRRHAIAKLSDTVHAIKLADDGNWYGEVL